MAGEVAVSTAMPAPGVSDDPRAWASFARRASRLLPYVQIGLRGDNANQCTVSPACSLEASVHAELSYAKLTLC
jgi:hypothetical protein